MIGKSNSTGQVNSKPVYCEVISIPLKRWITPSVPQVETALRRACVDYRGWPYLFFLPNTKVPPQYGDGTIGAITSEPFYGSPRYNRWSFNYEQGEFYSRNMTTESSMNRPDIIDPSLQARLIGEVLIAIGRLYDGLGVEKSESVQIAIRYSPALGMRASSIKTVHYDNYTTPSFADNELKTKAIWTVDDLLNDTPIVSSNIVDGLLKRMGSRLESSSDRFRAVVAKHLERGHQVQF